MKKAIPSLTFLVVLFCSFAASAEFRFGGEVKTHLSLYEGGNGEAELQILPEAEWRPNENLSFFIRGVIRADRYSNGLINSFSEGEDRWVVNVSEAYAEYSGEKFSLTIGKQDIKWGVTHIVSPSDLLNSRDYSDIPQNERVGIPAARLKIGDDRELFMEAVYAPFLTPSKLPQGEWKRELPLGVSLGEQEYEKNKEQFALRVGITTDRGTDLTMAYYNGVSYSPQARVDFALTGVEVVPVYSDMEALTGTLAKELFGLIFTADAGWFDQETGDDFFQYLIGANRQWFNVFRPTDDLFLLVQYAGEKVFSYDRSVPEGWIDFRRVFNKNLMGKAIYNFSDLGVWSLEIEATHNLSEKDGYAEATVHYSPSQFSGIEVEIGVGVPYGPKDTFWGPYGSRAFAGVSFKF